VSVLTCNGSQDIGHACMQLQGKKIHTETVNWTFAFLDHLRQCKQHESGNGHAHFHFSPAQKFSVLTHFPSKFCLTWQKQQRLLKLHLHNVNKDSPTTLLLFWTTSELLNISSCASYNGRQESETV